MSRHVDRAVGREIIFDDGDFIVREGDPGRELYLVRSGRVNISRTRNDRTTVLEVVEQGGFFGEMALLESLPRDADARAQGTTTVLAVGPGGLLLRLRRDPSLALEMLQRLSGRVRLLNHRVDELESGDSE